MFCAAVVDENGGDGGDDDDDDGEPTYIFRLYDSKVARKMAQFDSLVFRLSLSDLSMLDNVSQSTQSTTLLYIIEMLYR